MCVIDIGGTIDARCFVKRDKNKPGSSHLSMTKYPIILYSKYKKVNCDVLI